MTTLRISFVTALALAGAAAIHSAESQPRLTDLAWIAGDWEGKGPGGGLVRAHYSDASGGMIVSATKEIRNGRAVSYDFEQIAEKDGVVVYTPHPGGRKSDPFPLVSYDAAAKRVVFENLQHDFPKRFVFALAAPDTLVITLSGPGKDGKERELVYDLRRKR